MMIECPLGVVLSRPPSAQCGQFETSDTPRRIGDNYDELNIFQATISNDQRNICQRFGAEYMPPEASQKVRISLGALENVPLHAVRLIPENGTCGWYICGGECSTDADFYQPLHVVHLVERCPNIVPYLALPPGWRVLRAPDYEDVWFDGELLKDVSTIGFDTTTQGFTSDADSETSYHTLRRWISRVN